jgi:hypothetical protein
MYDANCTPLDSWFGNSFSTANEGYIHWYAAGGQNYGTSLVHWETMGRGLCEPPARRLALACSRSAWRKSGIRTAI